jgi:hypothetical protein
MPYASTAITCDHRAIVVFRVRLLAVLAEGAARKTAMRRTSTAGAL